MPYPSGYDILTATDGYFVSSLFLFHAAFQFVAAFFIVDYEF